MVPSWGLIYYNACYRLLPIQFAYEWCGTNANTRKLRRTEKKEEKSDGGYTQGTGQGDMWRGGAGGGGGCLVGWLVSYDMHGGTNNFMS